MIFTPPLTKATLVRRYKRFLADVTLADGTSLTVHCPNSGSMRGCSTPGSPVLISYSGNTKRKYSHTLELIQEGTTWIGINTMRTNHLVKEAILSGRVQELTNIDTIRTEVKTSEGSRLDLLLCKEGRKIYVEIKNCSLVENGYAMFPDAVTVRGAKHLRELEDLVARGHEGVIFFCVQRMDAHCFQPAAHIDPVYSEALSHAHDAGVTILVYQAEVTPEEIHIVRALPYSFPMS